jgi:hypothetical protein
MPEEERTSSTPLDFNGTPGAVADHPRLKRPFELDRPFQPARAPW